LDFLCRLRQISIFRSAHSLKALKLSVNNMLKFTVGDQNQKCLKVCIATLFS
jgi:hypothetical protein